MKECHVVIDGNSLYARCYFAASKDPEFLAGGGATQLAISMICKMYQSLSPKPTHGLICWDCGSKTDKKRGPKPAEFQSTLEDQFAPTLTKVFGFSQSAVQGYEADDMVATAVERSAAHEDVDTVVVVSGDKDLFQLWSGKVLCWSLIEKCLMSPRQICNKHGLKAPKHLPVALAILGDSVDNIPGVYKWGAKKVQQIFENLSPEASVLEAAEHAASFMNPEQLSQFEESLAVTLLNTQIEGVPAAEPMKMDPQPLFELGWERCAKAVKGESGTPSQGDLFIE